ncbi:MAG: FUSC family protein [Nevskia sp.]
MNAIAADPRPPAPRQVWREAWKHWAATEGRVWIFVAKTVFASLLALWLAFRLGFDSPRSAMLTVFIVAQPQTGLVLAKSFYRIVGTMVGCLATFLLVGLFAQQRELFLAAMALWVGLCTAGAALYRNFRAYAFVLAGYTACLIGFPSALHPGLTFDIAVARVSEVLLGILCAGAVTDLVLPQALGSTLVGSVRSSYREFLAFVAGALRGQLDHATMQRAHDRFLDQVIAFEAQRDAAYFESPDARVRSGRLRLLNAEFMSATTGVHSLHQLMQRLRRRGCQRALDRLAPLYALLADQLLPADGRLPATAAEAAPLALRLADFRTRLKTHVAELRAALAAETDAAERLDFDSAAELLQRLAEAMHHYTESYASLARPGQRQLRPAPRYVAHADPIVAVLSGLRATAALLLLSVFWIGTAWPGGAGAATIACVFCCLFAAVPAPVAALRSIGIGFVGGLAAAFVCAFLVLPQLDGFPLLAAGMAPFIMLGVRLIASARTAGIGAGYCIMFGSTIGVENLMRPDPAGLLNEGCAALLGALVASLAFGLLVPAETRRLRLHLIRSLRRRALLACFGALPGLRYRFENSTRDLLSQLLAGADRETLDNRRLLARALSVLEAGHALIDLREAAALGTLPVVSRATLNASVRAIARVFEQPTPQRRSRALESLARAAERIDSALRDSGSDAAERAALHRGRVGLHVLRTLFLDDESFEALSSVEQALLREPGAADAA